MSDLMAYTINPIIPGMMSQSSSSGSKKQRSMIKHEIAINSNLITPILDMMVSTIFMVWLFGHDG